MKKRNTFMRAAPLAALAAGLVVIGVFLRDERVAAIGNPDIQPEFGLVSLASGQTARLDAVSLGGPDTVGDPNRLTRRLTLAFDIYGISDSSDSADAISSDDTLRLTQLRFRERQSRVVTLRPGEAASLDFVAAADGTFISAVMIGDVEDTPDPNRPHARVVPTLEIMQGGRTLFTHPALIKLFNPQPDPPGARRTPGI